jgi:NAD(P)H-dependent FMN reductase
MTNQLTLKVVIASTRPGRVGLPVGTWFYKFAQEYCKDKFNVELVDLAAVNLPFMDEAKHPMMQQYEHEHTRQWAKTVSGADAFVFCIPEYNYQPPATLVNAVDYLYKEWNYKPCGLLSYGGVSGGMRAQENLKPLLLTVKMHPLVEQVIVPMVHQKLDVDTGLFKAEAIHEASARTMLDELHRWTKALAVLRTDKPVQV